MSGQRVCIETVDNGFVVNYHNGSTDSGCVVFTEWGPMLKFACTKLGKDPEYVVEFKHQDE